MASASDSVPTFYLRAQSNPGIFLGVKKPVSPMKKVCSSQQHCLTPFRKVLSLHPTSYYYEGEFVFLGNN